MESRGHSYGESRRQTTRQSINMPNEITSSKISKLKKQLSDLKLEIKKEEQRQKEEHEEEERLLNEIAEAQEKLNNLRKNR